jgi:mono/diheme cytochrome c family protein
LIVTDEKFPAAYRRGAFIAFHGSWNRAPAPQEGYDVVFQPWEHGKATGKYFVFADGFAGAIKEPGNARFRPTGLAAGPDGALYIADDSHGRIWRVTYQGAGEAQLAAAPAVTSQREGGGTALPPEGIHPDAGSQTASLPIPAGATRELVERGERIFHGQASNGTCAGCHGSDGHGSPIGADLTSGTWLWSDGSLAGLTKTISEGVMSPKKHLGAMPPMGGSPLSPEDLKAVSAYVWAIGHPAAK